VINSRKKYKSYHTVWEEKSFSDLNDWEAHDRIREEYGRNEREVNNYRKYRMLWKLKCNNLLHVATIAQIAQCTERAQNDKDDVYARVHVLSE